MSEQSAQARSPGEKLVAGGRIVQLCPVHEGIYLAEEGKPHVVALALIEAGDGKRDVLPVVYGYDGEPDELRLWTPPELGDGYYDLCAFGDVIGRPSLGNVNEDARA